MRYLDGTRTTQRAMENTGLTHAEIVSQGFIAYTDRAALPHDERPGGDEKDIMSNLTGTVDMGKYLEWLNAHGYDINLTIK